MILFSIYDDFRVSMLHRPMFEGDLGAWEIRCLLTAVPQKKNLSGNCRRHQPLNPLLNHLNMSSPKMAERFAYELMKIQFHFK